MALRVYAEAKAAYGLQEVRGALLCEGLSGAARTRRVDEIRGKFVAIDLALERLRPGDLSLILVDQVDEAMAYLVQRCSQAQEAGQA